MDLKFQDNETIDVVYKNGKKQNDRFIDRSDRGVVGTGYE